MSAAAFIQVSADPVAFAMNDMQQLAEPSPATWHPPSRKPTGAQLYRRMLSDPDNKAKLRALSLLPFGSHQMLRCVANLVAASPDGACFKVCPQLLQGGVAEGIAIHEGMRGAADGIEKLLTALQAAQMITLDDTSVRLNLPPERERRPRWTPPAEDGQGSAVPFIGAADGRPPSTRIGRRRNGESWEDYNQRHETQKQRHAQWLHHQRRQMDGQRTLPMPPVAVGGTSAKSAGLSTMTYGMSARLSATDFGDFLDVVASPTSGYAAVVAVESSNSGYNNSLTTTAAPREADLSSDLSGDLNAADLISPELSEAADRLSGMVTRQLAMGSAAAARVRPAIVAWLRDRKAPPDVLHAVFQKGCAYDEKERAAGKPGIGSINWFETPIADALKAWHARASPPYQAVSRADSGGPAGVGADPRLAAVPRWAGASPEVASSIRWLLNEMAKPPGSGRASMLRTIRTRCEEAFSLVAAERPEILAIAVEDSG